MNTDEWILKARRKSLDAMFDLLDADSDMARLRTVRRLLCLTGDLSSDGGRQRTLRGWISTATDDQGDFVKDVRSKAFAALEDLISSDSDTAREMAIKTVEAIDRLRLQREEHGWTREMEVALLDTDPTSEGA